MFSFSGTYTQNQVVWELSPDLFPNVSLNSQKRPDASARVAMEKGPFGPVACVYRFDK